jgi:nitroreductase
MFNDISSPLALLHSRRSAKPRDMRTPGPDAAQLEAILQAGMRVPDHGKLAPWRFIVVEQDARAQFAALLQNAYQKAHPEATQAQLEAQAQFAHQAPCLVVVVSEPKSSSPIPLWEQELSAGAACMNILHAASALGYAGGWLTGWMPYHADVRAAFSAQEQAKIAGFIFIGTPPETQSERPRPEYNDIVSSWNCKA